VYRLAGVARQVCLRTIARSGSGRRRVPLPFDQSVIVDLLLALGLGLLVGFQRQAVHEPVAGIRTFALVTLLGCLCGLLVPALGAWIVPAGLLAVASLLVAVNVSPHAPVVPDHGDVGGLTTEISALVLFLVGAWLPLGSHAAALMVAGAVAVLLWAKERLHRLVAQTSAEDLRALMQFVLIALVILPILPDRPFGPYAVLNPREIWLIVVLVVGVSLAGYVAQRAFGARAGMVVTGLLGGVISSTATTVSMARRAADEASPVVPAIVTVIASTVSFIRVALLALALAGPHAPALAGPFVAMSLAMVGLSAVLVMRQRGRPATDAPPQRPRELSTAITFAALYAVVILAVAFARDRLGTSGLYGVSVLAGLTDVDAISLSTARLVAQDDLPVGTVGRMILVACLSNLVFKGGVAVALGSRPYARIVTVSFGIALLAGVLLLAFWP
jgi:uncharacterized membrane protein (DUF4010 family)